MRVCLAASAFIEGPPCHVSSAVQPREPRWSPSGVIASVHAGNTLGGPSVWPTSTHVSRRRSSSRGWAWPTLTARYRIGTRVCNVWAPLITRWARRLAPGERERNRRMLRARGSRCTSLRLSGTSGLMSPTVEERVSLLI